jgi:F420-dependent oxidoreductase-like protein
MARFGLQIPNFSFGVPDSELFGRVADLTRAAENGGFESVWVMDHLYQLPALGGSEQPMLESCTLLGALAALTSRVRLGALVSGVTYRNPALLGKATTTLDVVSGGRAILGLGAAWYDVEHDAFGYRFPPAAERLDMLAEAVQVCRAMFTQEAATFQGPHFAIRELRNVPRPLQHGGPPIMIGGGGEKRTLRLVAQYADMCNVFGDAETIRHKLSVLRAHCSDVGRAYSEITPTRLGTLILTESEEQTANVREMLAASGSAAAAAGVIGTEKEIVAQVEELLEAGIGYFIFNMPVLDAAGVFRAASLLTASFPE